MDNIYTQEEIQEMGLYNNRTFLRMQETLQRKDNEFLKSPYPKNYKPTFEVSTLPSMRTLIRVDNIYDAFYYDYPTNSRYWSTAYYRFIQEDYYAPRNLSNLKTYFTQRFILTKEKENLIDKVKRNLSIDKSFLDIIHKAKTEKRNYDKNKFCGNLSIVDYAKQNDKMFSKQIPGKKKQTLNLAFQVGTFCDGNYVESFTKILKTVLMCQALGIHLNIDMFDSDNKRAGGGNGYIIINVAKSYKKLNFVELLTAMHREFFNYTLFNGYVAMNKDSVTGGFLDEDTIVSDLSDRYDIIGGNMLNEGIEKDEMVSRILKISNICQLED